MNRHNLQECSQEDRSTWEAALRSGSLRDANRNKELFINEVASNTANTKWKERVGNNPAPLFYCSQAQQ